MKFKVGQQVRVLRVESLFDNCEGEITSTTSAVAGRPYVVDFDDCGYSCFAEDELKEIEMKFKVGDQVRAICPPSITENCEGEIISISPMAESSAPYEVDLKDLVWCFAEHEIELIEPAK